MSRLVGIILVNYQDYAVRFLKPCRDSLHAQTYPVDQRRIYIVDNGTTAESAQYLKDNYPEAIILSRADGNYTAANNCGFNQAIADGCKYLVSVNMDTVAEKTWLQELVAALDNNPTAGVAQSKILLWPRDETEREKPRVNSLGNVIHFLGFGFTSSYGEPDREVKGYPEIRGYASGCSFIIRAEAWQKIGGYDEEYYMYHDDLALSLKARLAGYKIILAPRSIIFHKYEFSRSTRMLYYMERNRYLTLLTFYPTYLFILVGLPAVIMDLGMLAYSIFNRWFLTELKVYSYFCRPGNYVKIQTARQKIKTLSVVPFSQLARDFSGKIEFQEIANPVLKYLVNPFFNLYWQIIKRII